MAADSICIRISDCEDAELYIIEKYEGTLEQKKIKDKVDQIKSTIAILKNNKLFGDFASRFSSRIKTAIVCEKFGSGGRDLLALLSRPTVLFQYKDLKESDEFDKIAKCVYDKK